MYKSELAKLLYSRALWIVAIVSSIGVIATSLLSVFARDFVSWAENVAGSSSAVAGELDVAGFSHASMQWATLNISGASGSSTGISAICLIVLGLLNVTGDFRFGSMSTTLIASPSRTRALAARGAAIATVAAAIAVVLVAITAVALTLGLVIHGVPLAVPVGGMLTNWLIEVAALIAMALIGMGVGLIVRSQVAALVIVFTWVFAESLVRSIVAFLVKGTTIADFLPLGLGTAVNHGSGEFSGGALVSVAPSIALIALIVWMVCTVGVGGFTLRRRDVPA
ncbi:hypothetical protein [Spelaeicoccus albus]|uniref:ABC-type transport system involved in multi-copper enzyme maturation permease subunit n=1 Tax=Spelaeicoccus albus TaxID=1280376 RepID=A0A7Z0CZG2_9MICO|nr:hypothetical protein [Spelaeicoccus albus]NYI66249.1 ABC-type transport system involved in multi-copper enzyme maturation permease subunit [Spelaeicoccus albus]